MYNNECNINIYIFLFFRIKVEPMESSSGDSGNSSGSSNGGSNPQESSLRLIVAGASVSSVANSCTNYSTL